MAIKNSHSLKFNWKFLVKTTHVPKLNIKIASVTGLNTPFGHTHGIRRNNIRSRGGRICVHTAYNTYFYLEFHISLNSCNTKSANIGVQWGLVDH